MAIAEGTVIDIPLLKIADWLAERKFLQQHWLSKNKALQIKASELSQDLPAELQAFKGLKDYLTAKRVRDQLIQGAEKNFLGYYKGDAGLWDKLIRAYEIENVHIGETALRFVRNGEYEVPFLQSQISKQQQQLVDFEKKEAEYSKMALNAQKNHLQECAALGIQGNDIPTELKQLTTELPSLLFDAANQLKGGLVQEAIAYYTEFTQHTGQGGAGATPSTPLLPRIAEIQAAELNLRDLKTASEPKDAGEVLCEAAGSQEDSGVDWDIEPKALDQQAAQGEDIDWDIEAEAEAETTSFGIETADAGPESSAEAVPFTSDDVMSRLTEDTAYRSEVGNELSELKAFLRQRCSELASGSQQALAAATPATLQQTSLSSLQQMEDRVSACQAALASDRVKMLSALRTSVHYFHRTSAALEQQAGQESKFYRLQREVQGKQQELQKKLVEDSSKLSSVMAETRELKAFVEDSISQLCKGCQVHVTGDINNTLLK